MIYPALSVPFKQSLGLPTQTPAEAVSSNPYARIKYEVEEIDKMPVVSEK